ncbi:MAG TPA: hypothetical protein VFY93_05410 [Planctomycetota bacterium]|nr:hypothetical protein [Planctomycetota bacterium]
MATRRLLAVLLAGWIAALPAHVAVTVCFCNHDGAEPLSHASGAHTHDHGHDARPEAGVCRCVTLMSSQDLLRDGRSADTGVAVPFGQPEESPAALASGPLHGVRHAIPTSTGPPTFLRLLVLLV